MILRFGNKNFANLGSSFFDTPTILTSYLDTGFAVLMVAESYAFVQLQYENLIHGPQQESIVVV
ncbi:hypothetical protein LH67_20710 [Xenorhabdus nematophila]|nr:hypothetical protein LH67_20710 [Xenorhabdus nematophila]